MEQSQNGAKSKWSKSHIFLSKNRVVGLWPQRSVYCSAKTGSEYIHVCPNTEYSVNLT